LNNSASYGQNISSYAKRDRPETVFKAMISVFQAEECCKEVVLLMEEAVTPETDQQVIAAVVDRIIVEEGIWVLVEVAIVVQIALIQQVPNNTS